MSVSNAAPRLALLCVVVLSMVCIKDAQAANYYFDVNGATAGSGVTDGSTYSWESAVWNNNVSAGNVATVNYVDGNFPRFAAGTDATGSYTVTANSNHSTVGMIVEDQAVGATLTLNGTGVISITGGVQGVIGRGGDNLKIFNKISGSGGGINFQTSGGTGLASLFLYGNNDYALGTLINTGGGLNFNNNNSFGTGSISWAVAAPVLAAPDAASPITIANPLFGRTTAAASNLTVTGAQPVTFTSAWSLVPSVTQTLTIGSGAFPSFVNTFSGNLTGSASSILKAGPGVLVLSGTANNYTGTTQISAGTLRLGATNAIASTSSVILSGGTLESGAYIHTMSSTTLALTANSGLNVTSGELDFANSQATAWTASTILNVIDGIGRVRFGTDATGLTGSQLGQIIFDGDGTSQGSAFLDPNGYLMPEPTAGFVLLGAPLLLARRRRKRVI